VWGSPIVQDGRPVGAITHVLISNPTTGYGIFIENMLGTMAQAGKNGPHGRKTLCNIRSAGGLFSLASKDSCFHCRNGGCLCSKATK